MENRNGTPIAVFWAAILHIGIVAFLGLAIIPCSDYEKWGAAIGLPADWNPLTCPAPIQLPGEIIEATLIGPTGAPPPKHTAKPVKDTVPPPPAQPTPPPPPPPDKPKVDTLPPVPKTPAPKDQEKIVDDAVQKAEDAKRTQEETQRQRQAEIDAQAQKKKDDQKKIDDIFKQLDAASAQTKQADSKKKQAEQQLKDLENAKPDGRDNLPPAEHVRTGNNGKDSKQAAYLAAISNAVTPNWLRPDNLPDAPCLVHIVQIPGGQVLSAKADASCPYDASGKASIENAVLRSQPLPYQGFESEFQRNLNFTFRPQ